MYTSARTGYRGSLFSKCLHMHLQPQNSCRQSPRYVGSTRAVLADVQALMYRGLCYMDQYEISDAEWKDLEHRVIWRDGRRCKAACGCTVSLTVHHIIPRSEGGCNDPDNLITLCHSCHDEIEETSIRTLAGVRAYIPKWHATVSWYPHEVISVPKAHPKYREKRKPKPDKTEFTWRTCEFCGERFVIRPRQWGKRCCSYYCRMQIAKFV